MRIIGDVHGNTTELLHLLEQTASPCVQVGDYSTKPEDWVTLNDLCDLFVVPGNHDHLESCSDDVLTKGFGILPPKSTGFKHHSVMWIRGAESVDRAIRKSKGLYHSDSEELTYGQLMHAQETYAHIKPDVMITHDSPAFIAQEITGNAIKSRTQQFLQVLYEIHQPQFWFFGHHHVDKRFYVDGEMTTDFYALGELSYVDLKEWPKESDGLHVANKWWIDMNDEHLPNPSTGG